MNNITLNDFKDYKAKYQRQHIRPISEFIELAKTLLDKGVALTGDKMPWRKTHDNFRFREGELTIWSGVNGNGKSLVLGQVALWLSHTRKILIASMEMKAEITTARIIRQAAACEKPHPQFFKFFDEKTNDKLWLYDQTDNVQSKDILAMIDYACEIIGINHIVIDSLMMCSVNLDDNESQKRFVADLTTKAKKYNIHIHLVTHARKTQGLEKNYTPSKHDISGSASIGNLAFNILIVHLNQEKKAAIEKGENYNNHSFDVMLNVAKQRNGDFTGEYGFYFNRPSMQITEDLNRLMVWSDEFLPQPIKKIPDFTDEAEF